MEDREVSLEEMLTARELRVEQQKLMTEKFGCPLLCFFLNIPGPMKTGENYQWAFCEGIIRIEKSLRSSKMQVKEEKIRVLHTGYEYYAAVEADPWELKESMEEIEERDSLGRLFDIDVLTKNLTKISRTESGGNLRRCLICEEPAYACAGSRKHSVEEMLVHIDKVISESRKHENDRSI